MNQETTAVQQTDIDVGKNFFSQLFNLSSQQIIALYNLAVKSFTVGDYSTAIQRLSLLTTVAPREALYFKSMGGCYHATKDYMNAILYYQYAYNIDNHSNADCLFFNGVCLFELKNYTAAKEYFEEFLKVLSNDEALKTKAALYLKIINNS